MSTFWLQRRGLALGLGGLLLAASAMVLWHLWAPGPGNDAHGAEATGQKQQQEQVLREVPTSAGSEPAAAAEDAGPEIDGREEDASVPPLELHLPDAGAPAEPVALPPLGDSPIELLPVAAAATPGDGLTVTIVGAQAIDAQARGVGELSGPAVVVAIEVSNEGETLAELDADVTAYYGESGLPASSVASDPRHVPLPASVDAGQSAQGSYVVRVPATERTAVAVVVLLGPERTPVAFAGPLG
ncbi:MAG: hypothetical protein ACTMIR_01300 [Cellulomonadaceae bacterium]